MGKTVKLRAEVSLELDEELVASFDGLDEKEIGERLVRQKLQQLDREPGVDALLPDVTWTEVTG